MNSSYYTAHSVTLTLASCNLNSIQNNTTTQKLSFKGLYSEATPVSAVLQFVGRHSTLTQRMKSVRLCVAGRFGVWINMSDACLVVRSILPHTDFGAAAALWSLFSPNIRGFINCRANSPSGETLSTPHHYCFQYAYGCERSCI